MQSQAANEPHWGVADLSAWPLFVANSVVAPDVHFMDEMIVQLRGALDRGERFCVLVDATAAKRWELPEVRRFAHYAKGERRLDDQVAACAIVCPSAFVRGAFRVLFAMRPPAHPYSIVRSRDCAEAYLAPFMAGLRWP